MNNSQMTFDIVVATRNRPDALSMSLPLMLRQSRQPESLIIVDSSDDHDAVASVVARLTEDWKVAVRIIKTTPNLALQRNIGLEAVNADVVMFPDDDSLWHPGVADAIMKVYEADKEAQVGGVCGKQVILSPLEDEDMIYRKSNRSIIKTCVQPIRNRFENCFFPKPFQLFAEEAWTKMPDLEWLDQVNAVKVKNMAGFRMSFRSSVLKEVKFDPILGSKVGYAQHEDMEASVHVLKSGNHLLGAQDARVFHHVFPSKRAHGFAYGFCQIANYAYVVSKHAARDSLSFQALDRFLRYKITLYRSRVFQRYDRDVFQGAKCAWDIRHRLLPGNNIDLPGAYKQICDDYL